jgi:hypothetical protein
VPIDAFGGGVSVVFNGQDLPVEFCHVADSFSQSSADHAQLNLGDVQP